MSQIRRIEFRGDSLSMLRAFPNSARQRVGFQLDLVQRGRDPDDWKPMNSVGRGVREIRIRAEDGIFRVVYVTKFVETVFVLHCFQKKSQKTSGPDIDLATRRYRELERDIRDEQSIQ